MFSTPAKIYREIRRNQLDLKTGIEFLISIIEKSQDYEERLESLKYLKELSNPNEKIYNLLENLLISDLNPSIRTYSANFIKEEYLEQALNPMSWALQYERNIHCYIAIVKCLMQLDSLLSKQALIKKLKSVMEKKSIIGQRRYDNRKFKKSLEIRLMGRKLKALSAKEIGEVLINHRVIANLVKKYHFVFFRWKGGLVSKLDLSELGWNAARTWDLIYEDKIENLSEIPGLTELTYLKRLNLSNNRLTKVKELVKLTNLTYLMLDDNRLADPMNLKYFKEMENLQFLSLKGNKLASIINKKEFTDTHLVLREYLAFQ